MQSVETTAGTDWRCPSTEWLSRYLGSLRCEQPIGHAGPHAARDGDFPYRWRDDA